MCNYACRSGSFVFTAGNSGTSPSNGNARASHPACLNCRTGCYASPDSYLGSNTHANINSSTNYTIANANKNYAYSITNTHRAIYRPSF